MSAPERLDLWTLDKLEELCAVGQSESEHHDFKAYLDTLDDEPKAQRDDRRKPEMITKLCCAFANSYGGYVILGVKQKHGKFSIQGIPPSSEVYAEFLKKVRAEPEIRIGTPKVLEVQDGRCVYIFEVPNSTSKPHLPIKDDHRIFWKRVGSECQQMSLSEIRLHMNNYEQKLEKLTLMLIDIHFKIKDLEKNQNNTLIQNNTEKYTFEVIDSTISETYSLTKNNRDFIIFLNQIRELLSHINGQRQDMIIFKSKNYGASSLDARADDNRRSNHATIHRLQELQSFIEKYLYKEYGIVNPYNPINAFNQLKLD